MIDLVIVGGGPVGLVAALVAHEAGLRTVVLEQRRPPIDKACGEGLMPSAVQELHRLGVEVRGSRLRGVRYRDPHGDVVAEFADRPGLGAERTVLHAALDEAVRSAGVPVERHKVRGVRQTPRRVEIDGRPARYLIAADGLHSPIRHSLGLHRRHDHRRPSRYGMRAHFAVRPWSDLVEVHWGRDGEAYVTPSGPDSVDVALIGSRHGPYAERLADFPELLGRLPEHATDRPRAAGPLDQRSRRRVCGRVLLVGDAAGYVDALTGEGLATGFACARAAVGRIAAGAPDGYERDYARLTRDYRWLTRGLLWAAERPATRRRIVPTAARFPTVFRGAVNALAG